LILAEKEAAKSGKRAEKNLYATLSERVLRGGISSAVVASRNGKTAIELAGKLKNVKFVSVTEFTYTDDIKKEMKKLGIIFLEKSEMPIQDRREMRDALLVFGPGVKSAIEVAIVAAEKKLVEGRVIAVAGNKRRLDTALVLRPSTTSDISNPDPSKRLSVLELLVFNNNT
jgi:hypothetical protein